MYFQDDNGEVSYDEFIKGATQDSKISGILTLFDQGTSLDEIAEDIGI